MWVGIPRFGISTEITECVVFSSYAGLLELTVHTGRFVSTQQKSSLTMRSGQHFFRHQKKVRHLKYEAVREQKKFLMS